MTEAKKAAPAAELQTSKSKKVMKSEDKIKVKNVGKHELCLQHGKICRDKTGVATWAEYLNFSEDMEKV